MKCEVIIDAACEEKVVIFCKKNNKLVKDIQQLVEENSIGIIGYKDNEIFNLNSSDIFCIAVTDNKIYAVCEKERFQLKTRLYVLEEKLPETFVKINQSCIANIKKIERFDASVSGTLKIYFKNGYCDYVSRRQLKSVKERIGI